MQHHMIPRWRTRSRHGTLGRAPSRHFLSEALRYVTVAGAGQVVHEDVPPLTSDERYALTILRRQGYTIRGIARALGRAPSTIRREIRRNRRKDGRYRAFTADQRARARHSRSRRNQRFTAADWALVLTYLEQEWSPEQIAGRLAKDGILRISQESIYRYVWRDKRRGGMRYKLLRQAGKKRRKRYGAYDSRGRLAGNGYLLIGKMKARNLAELNRASRPISGAGPTRRCLPM